MEYDKVSHFDLPSVKPVAISVNFRYKIDPLGFSITLFISFFSGSLAILEESSFIYNLYLSISASV